MKTHSPEVVLLPPAGVVALGRQRTGPHAQEKMVFVEPEAGARGGGWRKVVRRYRRLVVR